jgi:hypothetical protein
VSAARSRQRSRHDCGRYDALANGTQNARRAGPRRTVSVSSNFMERGTQSRPQHLGRSFTITSECDVPPHAGTKKGRSRLELRGMLPLSETPRRNFCLIPK